ncbi:MAG: serine/threonine-protein phosphatase [Ruminiclostridium sp.]|nr:serine/threonine-protein phosphatase [Ruminiclostridium sp.]
MRKAYGQSHIGKVREDNQDSFYINESIGFYSVADGIGGLEAGEVASCFTLDELNRILFEFTSVDPGIPSISVLHIMVNQVSSELRAQVLQNTGTTLVFTLVSGREAAFVNVGDSPGYLFRKGFLRQITRDHNLAEQMVRLGRITSAQAKVHPYRNRLTAYIGMEGEVYPEIGIIPLQPEDRILLCSDGLTGMVSEKSIEKVLQETPDCEKAVKILVQMALNAGGHDNVSVVVVDI